jgi:hypothetical protein
MRGERSLALAPPPPEPEPQIILKENKNKSGIYRLTYKITGDFYIAGSGGGGSAGSATRHL